MAVVYAYRSQNQLCTTETSVLKDSWIAEAESFSTVLWYYYPGIEYICTHTHTELHLVPHPRRWPVGLSEIDRSFARLGE